MNMGEIEDLAGDLPPINDIDTAQATADVAIETAGEAVEIAQETLSEVQILREDQNQIWQTNVNTKLDRALSQIDQLLARLESMSSQPEPEPEPEPEPMDLTIETTPTETKPEPKTGKKKKSRKRTLRL